MRGFGSMTWLAGMVLLGGACGGAGGDMDTGEKVPTWEEFQAGAIRDEGDVYVFDGDQAVEGLEGLRAYYDAHVAGGGVGTLEGGLRVYYVDGVDIKWSATQARNLTYCVSSSSFGTRYSTVVNALASATAAWEATANINFIHGMSYDSNCTASQTGVLFDVRMVSGQSYLVRAFFPNASRSARNILIDSSAFGNIGTMTLTGLLRHELGHTLGFRHEYPEYSSACYEDNAYRALTPYDSASIMNNCSSMSGDRLFSTLDKQGARALYP
ncbi:dual-action HEIGH metallo-peptidase [Archangium gephyra]|uniref:Dual-action HEIGH metallo-peptidase n=1 Tax=Archangium gephyra TaxID=48 RepID=A0AAC8QAC0_9BACT|nr:M57 family metalloprotease [Archangium gephyra]AKJ03680.1 Hypothetical protein AA314_05306 [Archangium gephyra]REG22541.1 dual-action HEIGH metallo-peptidase [Archangium gephyra]